MPKHSSTSLTFYPAYCFSASPTFNAWARLLSSDIHSLKEREGFEGTVPVFLTTFYAVWLGHRAHVRLGQKIYFYLNHPIKWVRLVGVIVAFDEYPNRWIFQLDDSSGATVEVTCPRTVTPTTGTTPAEREESRLRSLRSKTISGNDIDMTGIDLGRVVKVKGGIGEFRGERQITLERISMKVADICIYTTDTKD